MNDGGREELPGVYVEGGSGEKKNYINKAKEMGDRV